MASNHWKREELLLEMNLYCRIPFGQFHRKNPDVIELAAAIGRTPSSVAMKLSNLASLDPFHKERGVKGLSGASHADEMIWDEFHSDWETLSVESERLRESHGLGVNDKSQREVDEDIDFHGTTEVERQTKVRLAQRFFRQAVLATYESRCCVSGITIPSLLVASHILPWSQSPEHRANPRNGLCLSRIHDAAFDTGLIGFDEDYRLILSKELANASLNQVLNACFNKYEGQPLNLPDRFRPERRFLDAHLNTIFKG